ncbi:MAG: adenylyltransferase/cytidyltransferase family protein [Phycisphaerales bacterium]|nr:adenylyltransferase/cytidyltransferase family protein [Phycisphaerales bacterium]
MDAQNPPSSASSAPPVPSQLGPGRKVLTREALLARRREASASGRVVVQCHGCFDLVHPGHVRHLQQAKRQGDILLVSITADAVMRKGDGRPLFPQELRAENLAALDCVDWVYINHQETAEALLEETRPDVYIKGREYESNNDPRFAAERAAVERSGGRVVFSSGDIVFSSTALISALEHRADPFHARLKQLVQQHSLTPERLNALIDRFAGQPVLVVGESIIDTYVLCDRPEVAGEAAVMSLRPLDRVSYDGGAAIIARHLAAMGARPTLVTALPRTPQAEAFRRRLGVEGVSVRAVELDDAAMLEKQRFLVGSQKVMKLDMVRPIVLDLARQHELAGLVDDASREGGGVRGAVLADFGNGLLTNRLIDELCESLRPRAEFMAGDVSGRRSSLLRMRDMDLLCPTELELRAALLDYDSSLNAVVWRLLSATRTRGMFVTMGADGLIAFDRLPGAEHDQSWASRVRGEHVPALAPHAVDQLGCGDALLATATLARLAGGTHVEAAFLGSIGAAVEASRLGNEVVSSADLRRGLLRLTDARLALGTSRLDARLAV